MRRGDFSLWRKWAAVAGWILLGVWLAGVWLVLKPVRVVEGGGVAVERVDAVELPFIKGRVNAAYLKPWAEKRWRMAKGEAFDFAFVEEELNAWMISGFEREEAPVVFGVRAEPVNFRMSAGVMQVAVPVRVTVLGVELPVVFQARGKIIRRGGIFVFDFGEIYAGSLPLHRIAGGKGLVADAAEGVLDLPADLRKSWGRLTRAEVEGERLLLTAP